LLRIVTAVSALMGGLTLTTALAGAAQAATPSAADGLCPQGYVCFWTGSGFTGELKVYQNPRWHTCDTTPAQPARSIVNNDDQVWSFYDDLNCSAHAITLSPGEATADVRVFSWE